MEKFFSKKVAQWFIVIGAAMLMSIVNPVRAVELTLLASNKTTSSPASATTPATTNQALQALNAMQVHSSYLASTRAELTSVARYPGQLDKRGFHPEGRVAVEFEITRQGVMQNARIVASSRSKILDVAAMASVRRAQFQACPDGLLSGESGCRFKATFDYQFDAQP